MKKLKKFNGLLSLGLMFVIGFSSCFVGCTDSCGGTNGTSGNTSSNSSVTPPEEGETDTATISLNVTSLKMTVGDYKQLTVTYSKIVDGLKLEWDSTAEQVAVVKNGQIEAISEGTAIIKAKYGEAEASCEVTVAFDDTLPQTKLGTVNSFCINKGDRYSFAPKIAYNGREFTDGTFTYTSSDKTVLQVQDNVITALKTGTAQIYIEGSWRGKTVANAPALQTVVEIEVVDTIKISLSGNEQSSMNIITLYTTSVFETDATQNEASFTPVVSKNGEIVSNAEYTVLNSDPSVAIYDQTSKLVKAVGYGEAVLTVQTTIDRKTHSKSYMIQVLRPEKTIDREIEYFSAYTGTLKTSDTFAEQTVIEHVLGNNDTEIVDAYQDGQMLRVENNRIFGVTNDRESAYETTLTIGTKTELYHIKATVYGMYVTQPSDLEVFVLNTDKKKVDLYVELGCDINAQNYTLPKGNWQITSKQESDGFTGVFNGNGYAIKNLKLQTNQGLFGAVTFAVIKNVAFMNWSYVADYAGASGILGVNIENATLTNVYVKINELPAYNQGANVLASYKIMGGAFKYVYVEYTEDIGEVTYDNCYSAFGAIMPKDEPSFENCLVVSSAPIGVCKTETSKLQVAFATNVSMEKSTALIADIKKGFSQTNGVAEDKVTVANMSIKGVCQYDTITDLQKDYLYTESILQAYSTQYWTVSENKLLWGKNNSEAVEMRTIRLDLGIATGKYVTGLQTTEIKAEVGDTVTLPSDLTCIGYVFKGWSYLGEMLENGQIVNYDGTAMTVVAVWEKSSNVIQTPII